MFCYGCTNTDKKEKSDTDQTLRIDTITKFDPTNYEEEINDTLVDSVRNIKIVIKKSTRMDKFITQELELDSLHFQRINYRDKTLEFKVLEHDKVIFEKRILKEDLIQINDKDFLSKSVMHGAWFESYDKETEEIKMSFNIVVPDTDWGYFFIMIVDKSGNIKIEEQIEQDEDF
ncbi:hypothetical protein SDC9_32262 [bioreactor metagenome]|jgi:hypothetical protein|uniref:DUF4738 domain-containing protein n=1 Tax=bioreactor metagenome TaxID=1076179 RepID=A0A644V649_9ZZZZ